MTSHSDTTNVNRKNNHAWLTDSRWSSNTFHTENDYWLTIKTLPGVIGGKFSAYVDGLQSNYYGTTQITIMSTVIKSSRNHDGTSGATSVTEFLEVESIDVTGPRIDFEFLIPFETTCLSDGANWTLLIEFSNGVTELFEIPVYRTDESDPELSEVKIASIHSRKLDDCNSQPVSGNKSVYSLSIDDNLLLQIPLKVSGKPSLFPGLAIFFGLWFAISVVFLFLAGTEVWFFCIPLPIMALLLVFLHQGTTTIEMNEEQLTIKQKLFGLSIPSRINKDDVVGFSTKCLGSMPSDNGSQAAYMLGVKRHSNGFKMLSAALLSQWESRLLIKRLSEYWDIKQ